LLYERRSLPAQDTLFESVFQRKLNEVTGL
jgi:hypothetical protein